MCRIDNPQGKSFFSMAIWEEAKRSSHEKTSRKNSFRVDILNRIFFSGDIFKNLKSNEDDFAVVLNFQRHYLTR